MESWPDSIRALPLCYPRAYYPAFIKTLAWINEREKSTIVYSAGDGLWKWLDYPLVQTHNLINTRMHTHTEARTCIKPLQNLFQVLPVTIITYSKYKKQSWAILIFFFFLQQPGPFSVVYIHVISSLISSEAKLALWFYLITRKIYCQGWGCGASLSSALPSAVSRILTPASSASSTATANYSLDAWKSSEGKGEGTLPILKRHLTRIPPLPFLSSSHQKCKKYIPMLFFFF